MKAGSGREHGGDAEEEAGRGEAERGGGGGGGGGRQGERGTGQEEDHGGTGDAEEISKKYKWQLSNFFWLNMNGHSKYENN